MKRRMSGTITVRVSGRSLKLLRQRAKRRKQTPSEYVRALIEQQRDPWPEGVSAWDLSREWIGSINDPSLPQGARVREAMEDWNPDRR